MGVDLKTYLNNVAQRRSDAANGNTAGRGAGGSDVMTAWETGALHLRACPDTAGDSAASPPV